MPSITIGMYLNKEDYSKYLAEKEKLNAVARDALMKELK